MSGKTTEKSGYKAKDHYREDPRSGIEAEELLGVARLELLMNFPFFGRIALSMGFVETDAVGTTAVDARGTFYYNRRWVNSFTKRDAVFEVGHEVMHLVQRLWERQPEMVNAGIWNKAADYLADTCLIDAKLPQSEISLEMVPEKIQDLAHEHDTMPAMYEYLLQQAKDNTDCKACQKAIEDLQKMQAGTKKAQQEENKQIKKGNEAGEKGEEASEGEDGKSDAGGDQDSGEDGHQHGSGSPCDCEGEKLEHTCGNVRECCAGSSADAEKMTPLEEQKWIEKVISAKLHAEGRGNMPAGLSEYIDSLTTSKVRWEDRVKVTAARLFNRGRYTYNRFNRRGPAMGVRLPGRQPEGRSAVIAIDTSASMSIEEVRQCLSEAKAILKLCNCEKVWLILHDAAVGFSDWVSEADLTSLEMGRGGTSHHEVFQCLDRTHPNEDLHLPRGEEVALLIAFTDLGTFFPDKPSYEILWGVPSDGYPGINTDVPYGTKVEVQMDA